MSNDASDLSLVVPAAATSVPLVRQVIGGVCAALPLDEQLAGDVRLAVTEACTNAVLHAYETPAGEVVEVQTQADEAELRIVVRDAGRGMGRWSPSAGLGLGLPLIAALTDSVEMRAGPGGIGTEVLMTFAFVGRAGAAGDAGHG